MAVGSMQLEGGDAGAAAKLKAPAISLIVLGAVGLALAAITMVLGAVVAFAPPDVTRAALDDPAFQDLDLPPNVVAALMYGGGGAFQALLSGATLAAGVQMLRGRTWTLGVIGAIAALFPCQCCCVTVPFGVWALIVLFDEDVRRTFA